MQESFLHFLWRFKRFSTTELLTTQGEQLTIIHPGEWNQHAGPDFFNARVRIGQTTWAGNIEIHVCSSEWYQHRHDTDPAYDNVVLHVVLEADKPVIQRSGLDLPCLELKGRIPPNLLAQYRQLNTDREKIPCANFWKNTPDIIRSNWLDRMLVERLEQKTEQVARYLAMTQNHWEEAFYLLLAANFGLKVNVSPFEMLARSLPLKILSRHRHSLFQLEALLFGQAGMLARDFRDSYPRELKKEFHFLRHKYDLDPLPGDQWKFLRLRPSGFPTIRLAQFAALLQHSERLLAIVKEARNLEELEQVFSVKLQGYWVDHYLFEHQSIARVKQTGKGFRQLLIMNAVVPFLFHYGREMHQDTMLKKALDWLEHLPPESNALLDQWASIGAVPCNAFQSQALLQLKTHWCDDKRCLECGIGNALLRVT
ncbi:MAG: DUF2851 family protein [Saprospiraceae bacterium]|nr:DUF2851 family protein [Saprospiraceae bacterium]